MPIAEVVPDLFCHLFQSKKTAPQPRVVKSKREKHFRNMSFIKRIGSSRGMHYKDTYKFQFNLNVRKITGLDAGLYILRWTKGSKQASTQPFHVPKTTMFEGDKDDVVCQQVKKDKLSLLLSLKRVARDEDGFLKKFTKLAIISCTQQQKSKKVKEEKTIAKMDLDLSEYLGVPSASYLKTFQLSSGIKVHAKLTSTYLKDVKEGGVASSVGSAVSRLTKKSSGSTNEPDHELELLAPGSDPENEPEEETESPTAIGQAASASFIGDKRKKKKVSKFAFSMYKSKAKIAELETENENLVRQLKEARNALQKVKIEKQVTNDSLQQIMQQQEEAGLQNNASRVLQRVQQENEELRRQTAVVKVDHEQNVAKLSERLANEQGRVSTLRNAKERLEHQIKNLEEEFDSVRKEEKVTNDNERLTKAKQDCDRYRKKYRSSQKTLDEVVQKAHGIELERNRLQRQLESSRKDNDMLQNRLSVHKEHANKSKETFDQLSTMYSTLRSSHIQLKKQESSTEQDSSSPQALQSSLRNLEKLQSESKVELEESRGRILKLQQEKSELDRKYARVCADNRYNLAKHADAQQELLEVRAQLERLREKNRVSIKQCSMHEADLEVASRLHQEACEKFGKKIASLEEEIDRLKKIQAENDENADLELMRTREKEYEQEIAHMKSEVDRLTAKLQEQVSTSDSNQAEEVIQKADGTVGIMDAQILNELVDTKMKLAMSEEEKLKLVYLIQKVKAGDTHIQDKLVRQASLLDVELFQSEGATGAQQDSMSRECSANDGAASSDDDSEQSQSDESCTSSVCSSKNRFDVTEHRIRKRPSLSSISSRRNSYSVTEHRISKKSPASVFSED